VPELESINLTVSRDTPFLLIPLAPFHFYFLSQPKGNGDNLRPSSTTTN